MKLLRLEIKKGTEFLTNPSLMCTSYSNILNISFSGIPRWL